MKNSIEITIPEKLFEQSRRNLSRFVLEEIAVNGYKSDVLTLPQVRKLLGFTSRFETEEFLYSRNIYGYTENDLKEDLETLKNLGLR